MQKFSLYLILIILILIPLYPKFPLVGVSGTFVSVRLEDFVILLVTLIWGAALLKRRLSDLSQPIPRAIIIYWIVGLVSLFSGIFLTKTTTLSLGVLHTFRRVEYMVLFLVGLASLKSLRDLPLIIRTVLLTSFLVALYGLGQEFLGFPVISTTNSEFSKGLALSLGAGARINSTFAGHYDLAAFSVFPLLLIISLLPVSRYKWFLLLIGGCVYWTLLLSASRITFASFSLCAALLMVLMRKKLWLVPLLGVSLLGFMASPQLRGRYLELITNHLKVSYVSTVYAQDASSGAISKDVNSTPDALKSPAQPEDRSFNIRLQAEWPKALRATYKNPVLGTGFSSVGLAVDNDYLRALAETGIFGLSAFALIFLRFFKTSLPYMLHYRQDIKSSFILAVSCSIISLLINALFIDIFAASKIAVFSWAIMGITEKTKQLS
jgi:hypothetical protein